MVVSSVMNRTGFLAPVCLLILALALRITLFGGVRAIDHIEIAHYSHRIVQGTYAPMAYHFPLRLAFLLPIAVCQAIFGLNDIACSLFPLACSLSSILLAYFAAKNAAGPKAGLIAGGVLAVLPLDVILATQLYPDGAATLLSSCAGFLFLSSNPPRKRLVVAGLLAGVAYLVKETGAFVMLLPVALALGRREGRSLPWAILGFAAVIVGELALWGVWAGDPLIRWRAASTHVAIWREYYPDTAALARRLTVQFPLVMYSPTSPDFLYFGPFFWLSTAALVSLRKSPLGRSVFLWIGCVFATILLFPVSLHPYRPALIAYARHLYPIVVPASVVIGVASVQAKRRRLVQVALLFHFLLCAASALWIHHYQKRWFAGVLEAVEIVRREGPDRIYTEKNGVGCYEYRFGFSGRPQVLRHEYLVPAEFRPGLLIENSQWVEFFGSAPRWRGQEPASWTVLWEQSYPRRPSLSQALLGSDPGRFTVRVLRIPPSAVDSLDRTRRDVR